MFEFDPALVRTTGDPCAAIVLAYLIHIRESLPCVLRACDFVEATGLDMRQLDIARKTLHARGIAEWRRTRGGHKILLHDFELSPNPPEIANFLLSNKKIFIDLRNTGNCELRGGSGLIADPSFDSRKVFDAALSGGYDSIDHRDKCLSGFLIRALIDVWAESWGRHGRTTKSREKLLRDFVRDGGKISQLCKATYGMRWDPWEQREKFSDWKFLFGANTERFAQLYDDHGIRSDKGTRIVESRSGRTFTVPVDYRWTAEDEYCAGAGYDFVNGEWQ